MVKVEIADRVPILVYRRFSYFQFVNFTILHFNYVRVSSFVLDPNLSQAELMLKTISEIISQLVDAHEKKKDINLNRFMFDEFCRM